MGVFHYFEKKSDLLIGLLEIVDEYLEQWVFPGLISLSEPENLLIIARSFARHIDETV